MQRQGILSYRMEQGGRRLGTRWFDYMSGAGSDWPLTVISWFRRDGLPLLALLVALVFAWFLAPRVLRLARVRIGVRRVRNGNAAVGDATLLYDRMLDNLKRRGYLKPAWFTPAEFAASLPRTDLGNAVSEFTATYNEWRFGGRADVSRRLSDLLETVEQQQE
jgi:hypothetical protein